MPTTVDATSTSSASHGRCCGRPAAYFLPLNTMLYNVHLHNLTVDASSERDAEKKAMEALAKNPRAYVWRVSMARVYRRRKGFVRRLVSFIF